MKKPTGSVNPGLWTAVVLALGFGVWEWAAAAGHVDVFFFSSPSLIWAEFLEMLANGTLALHLSVTAKEAGLGLLLGGVLGTLTGLALGVNAFNALTLGLLGIPGLGLLFLLKWAGT